jgi:hypothetical protein
MQRVSDLGMICNYYYLGKVGKSMVHLIVGTMHIMLSCFQVSSIQSHQTITPVDVGLCQLNCLLLNIKVQK